MKQINSETRMHEGMPTRVTFMIQDLPSESRVPLQELMVPSRVRLPIRLSGPRDDSSVGNHLDSATVAGRCPSLVRR